MRLIHLFLLLSLGATAQTTVKPTPAQLDWHETNFYLFFHFGPNTFTNREWGHGTETEDLFNPSALDCEQWCRIAKAAGAKGIVLTAKHHDGFCLWPSAWSTHTVRESPWKNGSGDVVRELSDGCRKYGLKFGVYLSPWDRNHPQYGTPEYNDVYANTLTELLTNYGPLFEVWWDGANGEGPNGRKQEYDFHRFEKLVAQLQPDAVIFSDIGPGCRWAGNEQGTVAETNWCRLDTAGFGRGATGPPAAALQTGSPTGANWIPAECDVSIRPGWFYHAEEDDKVKTPEQLFDIYLKSVGRGANLILNVPPDRRGRIHERDSASLVQFGQKLQNAFAENFALGAKISPVYRGCLFSHLPDWRALTDNDNSSCAPAGLLVMKMKRKARFNTVLLRECLSEGQHVESFELEVKKGRNWERVAASSTIGNKKIVQFPAVEARELRLIIKSPDGEARISEWQVYRVEE